MGITAAPSASAESDRANEPSTSLTGTGPHALAFFFPWLSNATTPILFRPGTLFLFRVV